MTMTLCLTSRRSQPPLALVSFRERFRRVHVAGRRWLSFFVRPREFFEIFWRWLAGGDFGLRKFVGSSEAS